MTAPATRFFRIASMLAILAGTPCSASAAAMDYPMRPVRVIVAFAPGGSADITARTIAQKLAEAFGQTVVVDNRAGASGIIGTELAARATPDGHTLLEATMTTHGIGPNLYAKLPYDPVKDFEPIVLMVRIPLVMFVHSSVPAATFKDFVALAKSSPGKLSYASSGAGSPPHLTAELLKLRTGIALVHVPYKGTGAAIPDVVAGQVHVMIDGPPPFLAHVKAGRLKALAAAGDKRNAQLPDVPTFAESGVTGMEAGLWYGMVAPRGTPRSVILRLNTEINRALGQPDVRERFAAMSVEIAGGTPEQFGGYVASELKRWGEVARAANIRAE